EPGKAHLVSYTKGSTTMSNTIQSEANGNLTIPNLSAGTYSNIWVTLSGCPSNSVGPFILADPNPPATPIPASNSPLCFGNTLTLEATTAATGAVTFNWSGPNGFSSTEQNPSITKV